MNHAIARRQTQFRRLNHKIGKMRSLLEKLQWSARSSFTQMPICPVCGGMQPNPTAELLNNSNARVFAIGHRDDCELAKALR